MKRTLVVLTLPALLFFAPACSDAAGDTTATVHVSAPGMHCDGCTATVEETFSKMEGVDSVYADLESKKVLVVADTSKSSKADFEEMIELLGFATAASDE